MSLHAIKRQGVGETHHMSTESVGFRPSNLEECHVVSPTSTLNKNMIINNSSSFHPNISANLNINSSNSHLHNFHCDHGSSGNSEMINNNNCSNSSSSSSNRSCNNNNNNSNIMDEDDLNSMVTLRRQNSFNSAATGKENIPAVGGMIDSVSASAFSSVQENDPFFGTEQPTRLQRSNSSQLTPAGFGRSGSYYTAKSCDKRLSMHSAPTPSARKSRDFFHSPSSAFLGSSNSPFETPGNPNHNSSSSYYASNSKIDGNLPFSAQKSHEAFVGCASKTVASTPMITPVVKMVKPDQNAFKSTGFLSKKHRLFHTSNHQAGLHANAGGGGGNSNDANGGGGFMDPSVHFQVQQHYHSCKGTPTPETPSKKTVGKVLVSFTPLFTHTQKCALKGPLESLNGGSSSSNLAVSRIKGHMNTCSPLRKQTVNSSDNSGTSSPSQASLDLSRGSLGGLMNHVGEHLQQGFVDTRKGPSRECGKMDKTPSRLLFPRASHNTNSLNSHFISSSPPQPFSEVQVFPESPPSPLQQRRSSSSLAASNPESQGNVNNMNCNGASMIHHPVVNSACNLESSDLSSRMVMFSSSPMNRDDDDRTAMGHGDEDVDGGHHGDIDEAGAESVMANSSIITDDEFVMMDNRAEYGQAVGNSFGNRHPSSFTDGVNSMDCVVVADDGETMEIVVGPKPINMESSSPLLFPISHGQISRRDSMQGNQNAYESNPFLPAVEIDDSPFLSSAGNNLRGESNNSHSRDDANLSMQEEEFEANLMMSSSRSVGSLSSYQGCNKGAPILWKTPFLHHLRPSYFVKMQRDPDLENRKMLKIYKKYIAANGSLVSLGDNDNDKGERGTVFCEKFEILSTLGKGSFADVFHVVEKETRSEYAIKKTRHPFIGMKDRYVDIERGMLYAL